MKPAVLAQAAALLGVGASAAPTYIVTFKSDTPAERQEEHLAELVKAGGKVRVPVGLPQARASSAAGPRLIAAARAPSQVTHRYKLMGGFAGKIPEDFMARLRTSPDVAAIEADQAAHTMQANSAAKKEM